MKIRNGFISNSSSSSFVAFTKVVDHWIPKADNSSEIKYDETGKILFQATPEQVKRLKNYGFYNTDTDDPFRIESGHEHRSGNRKTGKMAFSVSRNEDYVITFLLKLKVPFKVAGHYGCDYYEYNPHIDKEILLSAHNDGIRLEMYGHQFPREDDGVHTIRVDEWIMDTPEESLGEATQNTI